MSSPVLKIPVYSQTGERIKELELNPKIFGVEPKESVVHQVAVAQMANARQVLAHTKDKGEVRGGGRKPWRQKGTGRARHGSIRSPLWKGGGVTFGPTKERNFSQKVNKKMKTKALFMCLSDKVNNNLLILLDKLNLEDGKTREMVNVVKDMKEILGLKKRTKGLKEKESVVSEQEELLKHESIKALKQKGTEIKSDVDEMNKSDKRNEDLSAEAQEQLEAKVDKSKFDIKKYKLSLLVVLPKSDKEVFQAGRNLVGVKITTADSLNVVDLLRCKHVLIVEDGLRVIEETYLP